MLSPMLNANDIQAPGPYWYTDQSGAEPTIVLVCADGLDRPDWEVSWFGREDCDRLNELPGSFVGPIALPPRAGVPPTEGPAASCVL
jgi:hypothetical protein